SSARSSDGCRSSPAWSRRSRSSSVSSSSSSAYSASTSAASSRRFRTARSSSSTRSSGWIRPRRRATGGAPRARASQGFPARQSCIHPMVTRGRTTRPWAPMSPGGHLVTTAIAGGAVLASSGSIPLTAGLVVGGFLIDVDHVVDYLLVERRRELTPAAFLRYYTEGH